jgi:pimeloyl-ACP methyl ester carboxylesterase
VIVVRPDGCRLYVEHHGDPSAPALLLLEGMGGDLPGWRRNIPTLAARLFVVALDHRGNGLSDDPTGPVTMSTFVEDAVAVLDDARVERAHVYGQSFGGMVAIEMALSASERVRSLVLAATHAGRDRAVVATARTPKHEPWRALYAPDFPDAHPDHVAEDLRAGAGLPAHPEGPRRQWEAVQAWSASARLGAVAVPTLVLHGTADQMVAPANAQLLADAIPGAELTWIDGAGHLYHSERAADADAAVLDFVERR